MPIREEIPAVLFATSWPGYDLRWNLLVRREGVEHAQVRVHAQPALSDAQLLTVERAFESAAIYVF